MVVIVSKKERKILFTFIIGLVCMLVARDIYGIMLNKFMFLGFCTAFFWLGKYETIIYMLCFMIPLFNGLPGTYILAVAIVFLIIKRAQFPRKVLVSVLLFILLEILASLWYTRVDFIEILEYVAFIFVFFLLLYDNSKKSYRLCVNVCFIGVLVFCSIVMISGIMTAPDNWTNLFAKGWFRFGETNTGSGDGMMLKANSNELAYFSIFGISMGFANLQEKKEKYKLLIILSMIVMGISGVLSLSRTFIILILLLFIILVISQIKKPKTLIIIAVLAFVLGKEIVDYLNANPDFMEGFITRFEDSTLSTAGGRTTGLKEQWNAFFEIPRCFFIGTGVTQYWDILQTSSIHNMISQIIICYGFLGGVYFLASIIKPIYKIKTRFSRYIPLIAVVLFTQTIQFVNPYSLMLPYAIGTYVLKNDKSI